MYVWRTLFICKENLVIYHLDYASYCQLSPFFNVQLEKSVLFSLLWVLVFVICSSVVCKPHFPVSARYSNQRANKNNLTVNVFSWEEKMMWQHSMYVSENSRWDFKVWPTLQSLSQSFVRSSLSFFQLPRRTRHWPTHTCEEHTSVNFSDSWELHQTLTYRRRKVNALRSTYFRCCSDHKIWSRSPKLAWK